MIPAMRFVAQFGGLASAQYSASVLVYFPGHRFDVDAWLSKPWKSGGVVRTGYCARLYNGFEKASLIPYLRFNY